MHSTVELSGLKLSADIGTYGPDDVIPDAHFLDMTLHIDPALVLIQQDNMASVFDYDPLVKAIDVLAQDGHYETQERLMTRIVEACIAFPEIQAVELYCYKRPVLGGTGVLGVRLVVDAPSLSDMREKAV